MSANENAPASNEGASRLHQPAVDSTPSEAALFAAARGYCVIVTSSEGKHRRRIFLSLHSAERAVQRAKARGCYAALVLAVIVPTGVAE